jgi:hypothetical protein
MQRRDFLGSMLAIFTGLALPAPVRDQIQVFQWDDLTPGVFFGGGKGGGKSDAYVSVFRQYYQLGITPRNRVILSGLVEPTQSVKVAQGQGVISLAAAPPGSVVSVPAAAGIWA